jgi:hypothetical protein
MTTRCNVSTSNEVIVMFHNGAERDRLAAVAAHPELDPVAFDKLWRPDSYRATGWLVLKYPAPQDVIQITREIVADEYLKSFGVIGGGPNGRICMGEPMQVRTVTEFHNMDLDHYFLSSTTEENALIDAGAAGKGWVRTGESFRTYDSGCDDDAPVYRFYGTPGIGPNSHFFTRDGDECGGLRRGIDPGWMLEGVAFLAKPPMTSGSCNVGLRPVYRLYNNRAASNDSNHRYVVRESLYREMQGQGWIGEGVRFCVASG